MTVSEIAPESGSTDGGYPLYVSIAEAAKIAGVSDEMMRAWANSSPEHIPYIQSGRKKLIRVAGIAAWAEKMEAA